MKNLLKIFILCLVLVSSFLFTKNVFADTLTVSVYANPTSVPSGGSSTISWTVSNQNAYCTISSAAAYNPSAIIWPSFLQKFVSYFKVKEVIAAGGGSTGNGSQVYNNILSTTVYTVTCSLAGHPNATQQATVTIGGGSETVTGNIDATGCIIQAGSSSCVSNINWSVSSVNPSYPLSITIPRNPPPDTTVSSGLTSGSGSTTRNITLENVNGTTQFELYRNGVRLDYSIANASCAYGSSWNYDTKKCVSNSSLVVKLTKKLTSIKNIVAANKSEDKGTAYLVVEISDLPSGKICNLKNNETVIDTYNTSILPLPKNISWLGNLNNFQLVCNDTNNTSSDTVTVYGQSGTLEQKVSSCTISSGGSTCQTSLSWTTTNPKDSYNTFSNVTPNSTGTSGNYVTSTVSVPSNAIAVGGTSGTVTISSKNKVDGENNGTAVENSLASLSVNVSCASGTTWNGSTCALPTTGTLTANPTTCEISTVGGKTCPSLLTLNVINPVAGKATNVTKPTNVEVISTSTINNVFPKSASVSVSYPSTTFYLNHNYVTLNPSGTTVNAICASSLIWNETNGCITRTYTITASSGANGSVTPTGVTTKNYGESQKYTITANSGYHIDDVKVDNVSVGAVGTYTFSNITANHTISATFGLTACANGAINPPTCTCSSGSVEISGICTPVTVGVTASPLTYNTAPNTNVPFTFTPTTNSGSVQCKLLDYALADLTSYASATKNAVNTITKASPNGIGSYSYYIRCQNTTTTSVIATSAKITVNTSCPSGSDLVSGTCRVKPYITVTQTSNGTISPGTTSVVYGSDLTFTISPNLNYYISSLTVDGSQVAGAPSSYTFNNIIANHSITASYAIIPCVNGATNPPTCTTCVSGSALVAGTCTPVTVGVTASPLTYNTAPNTNVPFTFTPTTNSGSVQCKLLDYALADLTSYTSATKNVVNTKTYASPNNVPGPFDYYIRCQNTTTTSAIATSAKITVNTACSTGTVWDSGSSSCKSPSGTLTAPNCSISAGGNSCSTTLNWNITNPIPMVTSYISVPPSVDPLATGISGTLSQTINYGSKTFNLNHNSIVLKTATSNASCLTPGTKWDSSTSTCVKPTGWLTITSCTIPANQSNCNITLEWSTSNPIGTSKVTTDYPSSDTIVDTGNNGTKSYSMTRDSRDFFLYNDTVELDRKTATVICEGDTSWIGGICQPDIPSDSNTEFTANPASIFKGRSATLTWNSSVATSCKIDKTSPSPSESIMSGGAKSGSQKVSPLVNSTYTLTCTNDAGSKIWTASIKVIDPKIEEN